MPITPGVLDYQLKLAPLSRISPSRYIGLKQCALREVWLTGGQPNLLPIAPAARLGMAIHQLLEEAGSGSFSPGDRAAISERLSSLVTQAERSMLDSWLEGHLVPLKDAIRDFEVRCIQARERAFEISLAPLLSKGENASGTPKTGTELKVASNDGLVVGYIDRVVMSEAGPIIRDYKSGEIMVEGLDPNAKAVRAEYATQLMFYAALYKAATGVWPARLEIILLHGDSVPLVLDPDLCSSLLDDARILLKQINEIILTFGKMPGEAEQRLARPSETNCRNCSFRPGCAAYQKAKGGETEIDAGARDLWGKVEAVRRLGNSKLMLSIIKDGSTSSTHLVTGLRSDLGRHPALPLLERGDRIGLYNFRYDVAGKVFTETPYSVIYKVAEAK